MDKVRLRIFTLTAFALIMAMALSGTASANLVPVQYGFPVVVQSGSTVSFSNDHASSSDSELFNMDFPAFDGISSGPAQSGFSSMPSIGAGQSLLAFPATTGLGNFGSMFGNMGFNLF